MAALSGLILFIFGTAIGSFLNVVILRYRPERPLFDLKIISGRSRCTKCKKVLSWTELIPLASFLFLRGKCSVCRERISIQYPLVEFLTGLVFLCIPLFLNNFYGVSNEIFFSFALAPWYYFLTAFWVLAFVCFILLVAIDLRHYIIPDELNVIIGVSGAFIAWLMSQNQAFLAPFSSSFVRHYALVFSPVNDVLTSHALGAVVAGLFFLSLVLLTRGRGMGMGDVKFMFAAGLLFGWPDVAVGIFFAFIIGGFVGAVLFFLRKKGMKDKIPFGPFLVVGLTSAFFIGYGAVKAYFSLFGA